MANFKSQKIANALADELAKRTTLTVAQSVDSSGNPTIRVGTGVAGSAGGFYVIKPIDWPNSYNIQLCTEAGADALASYNTSANIMLLLAPALRRGTVFEWYLSANGVAPSAAGITGDPAATFDDLYWPIVSAQ
jgi:hypothetical protein